MGDPGIGKTTIARAVAEDATIKQAFCVVHIWGVGRTPNKANIYREVCENFYKRELSTSAHWLTDEFNVKEARKKLENATTKKTLLILDDVWDIRTLEELDFCTRAHEGINSNKLLVTSRMHVLGSDTKHDCRQHRTINVRGLNEENACKLLRKFAKEDRESQQWSSRVQEVVQRCNYLPLALKVCFVHV